MLVSAGLFGDAAARDVQTGMHALFYTSPLREADYLMGRFLGAAAVNAVLLLGIPLGLLLASVMPYMAEGTFGPVQLTAYVQAYVLMLLPNLVLIGVCMFAAAALTRQALATYLGEVAPFVVGIIGAISPTGCPTRRCRRSPTRSGPLRSVRSRASGHRPSGMRGSSDGRRSCSGTACSGSPSRPGCSRCSSRAFALRTPCALRGRDGGAGARRSTRHRTA
jgi:hypothetical protein